MINIEIGNRIKGLREDRDLTQEDLAKVLGYTNNSFISKLENGNVEIKVSQLKMLSKYFKVSIDYLINGSMEDTITNNDNIISNNTKSIKVRTNFSTLRIIDIFLIAIIILINIIVSIIGKVNYFSFVLLITLIVLVYLMISITTRNRKSYTTITIPLDSNIVYKNSLNGRLNELINVLRMFIGLLVVVSFLYYGLMIKLYSEFEIPVILILVFIVSLTLKVISIIKIKNTSNYKHLYIITMSFLLEVILNSAVFTFLTINIVDINGLWIIQPVYFIPYLMYIIFYSIILKNNSYSILE